MIISEYKQTYKEFNEIQNNFSWNSEQKKKKVVCVSKMHHHHHYYCHHKQLVIVEKKQSLFRWPDITETKKNKIKKSLNLNDCQFVISDGTFSLFLFCFKLSYPILFCLSVCMFDFVFVFVFYQHDSIMVMMMMIIESFFLIVWKDLNPFYGGYEYLFGFRW